MAQTLHIDYFTKPYGPVGARNNDVPTYRLGQNHVEEIRTISTPKDFTSLARDVLKHLEKEESWSQKYKLWVSEMAVAQISPVEKEVLEGIIGLHNDFSAPSKRTVEKEKVEVKS